MKRLSVFCFIVVISGCTLQRLNAANVLYFTSAPGSWIGQGQTLTLTEGFYASRTFELGAYTDSVHFGAGGYELTLVGPDLTVPTVGFYNATRWPFMGAGAGMCFMGPGRCNNTLTGYFNVLQAEYTPSGQVSAFAVDFVQYDEGYKSWWNVGSVRYNSSLAVPEPSTTALGLIGLVMLYLRARGKVKG